MRSSEVTGGQYGYTSQYNNLRDDAKGASTLLAHEQSTPDMTVYVEGGRVSIGGKIIDFAGGNSPTITAPSTNPRIDVLTINSSGTLEVTAGTEDASPSAPDAPDGKLPICQIYLRTTSTSIKDDDDGTHGYIYKDVRPFIEYAQNPTGAIILYPKATAPIGFLVCDGSAVSRTTYSKLFSLIGETYGVGDGSTTFNLPDMQGMFPVGYDSADTDFDGMGETGGEKEHTLTEAELPAHTHAQRTGNAEGSPGLPRAGGGSFYDASSETGSAGSDTPHNNLPPYRVLQFIIKY